MGPSSDSLFVHPEHRACGNEILCLYGEGISKMPENPGIPLLFRDIFKNAYLPYRDPETPKAFLNIIDEFSYDHSERLGDAFEYLRSVLGSQGDAGQFRTPRHRKERPPAG
jgi:type I restriction enzyme M protein